MTIKIEGSAMRLTGMAMLGLGGLMVFIGLVMSGSQEDADVYNVGLLNQKANFIMAGGLMSVCGSIFFTADQIISRLGSFTGAKRIEQDTDVKGGEA